MASSLFFGLLFVSVIAVFVAADAQTDANAAGGNQAASTDGASGGLMGAVTNVVKAFVKVPMDLLQQGMAAFNNLLKTFTDALANIAKAPASSGAPAAQ